MRDQLGWRLVALHSPAYIVDSVTAHQVTLLVSKNCPKLLLAGFMVF
jgi:hypothetical protein